jgi:hypothetical protein
VHRGGGSLSEAGRAHTGRAPRGGLRCQVKVVAAGVWEARALLLTLSFTRKQASKLETTEASKQ